MLFSTVYRILRWDWGRHLSCLKIKSVTDSGCNLLFFSSISTRLYVGQVTVWDISLKRCDSAVLCRLWWLSIICIYLPKEVKGTLRWWMQCYCVSAVFRSLKYNQPHYSRWSVFYNATQWCSHSVTHCSAVRNSLLQHRKKPSSPVNSVTSWLCLLLKQIIDTSAWSW